MTALKYKEKAGQPPGTLIYSGEDRFTPVKIMLVQYNADEWLEEEIKDLSRVQEKFKRGYVHWIDFEGVHDVTVIEKCGELFGIHPLTLEDIVNTHQRPKFEEYDDYVLAVMKQMQLESEIVSEQISIILSHDLVLSFQESRIDCFNALRERIRHSKGRIRKCGADYLTYALLDSIVDGYFLLLERFSDRIEDVEEDLIANPTSTTMRNIHRLKRDIIFIRKAAWPLRDLVSNMERSETNLISASTDLYLRDLADHAARVIDSVETFRDLLASMMDIYLSSISNRMNEVMKVLTVISTIFIPITFIVGVYGMNFKYMPELDSPWGYPMVWAAMLVIVVTLLAFFRRKRWI